MAATGPEVLDSFARFGRYVPSLLEIAQISSLDPRHCLPQMLVRIAKQAA